MRWNSLIHPLQCTTMLSVGLNGNQMTLILIEKQTITHNLFSARNKVKYSTKLNIQQSKLKHGKLKNYNCPWFKCVCVWYRCELTLMYRLTRSSIAVHSKCVFFHFSSNLLIAPLMETKFINHNDSQLLKMLFRL